MKRIISGLAALLFLFSAHAAGAQQPEDPRLEGARAEIEDVIERSGIRSAVDSLATAAAPELERTMEQLAATLNALTTRIANDPELRGSAIRAAQGLVEVAELVVVEQSSVIQEALRTAAERIARLPIPTDPEAETRQR
jgi:hypothetical protein